MSVISSISSASNYNELVALFQGDADMIAYIDTLYMLEGDAGFSTIKDNVILRVQENVAKDYSLNVLTDAILAAYVKNTDLQNELSTLRQEMNAMKVEFSQLMSASENNINENISTAIAIELEANIEDTVTRKVDESFDSELNSRLNTMLPSLISAEVQAVSAVMEQNVLSSVSAGLETIVTQAVDTKVSPQYTSDLAAGITSAVKAEVSENINTSFEAINQDISTFKQGIETELSSIPTKVGQAVSDTVNETYKEELKAEISQPISLSLNQQFQDLDNSLTNNVNQSLQATADSIDSSVTLAVTQQVTATVNDEFKESIKQSVASSVEAGINPKISTAIEAAKTELSAELTAKINQDVTLASNQMQQQLSQLSTDNEPTKVAFVCSDSTTNVSPNINEHLFIDTLFSGQGNGSVSKTSEGFILMEGVYMIDLFAELSAVNEYAAWQKFKVSLIAIRSSQEYVLLSNRDNNILLGRPSTSKANVTMRGEFEVLSGDVLRVKIERTSGEQGDVVLTDNSEINFIY